MFFLISIIITVLDQIIKFFVVSNMQLGQSIPVIENIFHLTYILNDGAAFSILEGRRWFFVLLTLVVMVVIFYYLRSVPKDDKLQIACLAIFAGGTMGNFIDRLLAGAVVDYLDFRFFPIFNLADICIVCGAILLCILTLKSMKTEGKHE